MSFCLPFTFNPSVNPINHTLKIQPLLATSASGPRLILLLLGNFRGLVTSLSASACASCSLISQQLEEIFFKFKSDHETSLPRLSDDFIFLLE